MKDRVSLYPGRIRLIPVEGQDNVYDLVRADEPIEEGTPLNKANILKDSTIQKYVNANINVPDDVFNYLGNYAEYWWKRTSLGTTKYRELLVLSSSSSSELLLSGNYYYDSVNVNEDNGEVTPNGVGTLITESGTSDEFINRIKGKYVVNGSVIAKIVTTGTPSFNNVSGTLYIKGGYYYTVSSETYIADVGIVSYVRSTNRNAYPDTGELNGFSYEYVGIPFENMPNIPVKIETGSYVGTGTYGSSNPNSLTFSFKPKLVMFTKYKNSNGVTHNAGYIFGNNYSDGSAIVFDLSNISDEYSEYRLCNKGDMIKLVDNTFSWYTTYTNSHATTYQLNDSAVTYNYVAIG